MTSGSEPGPPTDFYLNAELRPVSLPMILPSIAEHALPRFLPRRRWFGRKQGRIQRVSLADVAYAESGSDFIALGIVTVAFADGSSLDYFVPIAFTPAKTHSAPASQIATVHARGTTWAVVDAPAVPSFRDWLLRELAAAQSHAGAGAFVWQRSADFPANSIRGGTTQSRVVASEQSNTSIIYADTIMLKVFRRIDRGINPEVEVGRFLTTRTGFRNVPLLFGDLQYIGTGGDLQSLAVAQAFIPDADDGWSYALGVLTPRTTGGMDAADFASDARALGQRTAQLHLALASNATDPAFRPDPITADDVQHWSRSLRLSIERVNDALASLPAATREPLGELIEAFHGALEAIHARLAGLEMLIGLSKTRVHGDYHLGQTLRTAAGDYILLDFEGEPQRSLAERRKKTTPLKDVAGMLRSFGYARGMAEQVHTGRERRRARDFLTWERRVRQAFLDAYFTAAHAERAPFLPSSREDFRVALIPWELDKALYEVEYEMNNRPDWLWLPLTATLRLA